MSGTPSSGSRLADIDRARIADIDRLERVQSFLRDQDDDKVLTHCNLSKVQGSQDYDKVRTRTNVPLKGDQDDKVHIRKNLSNVKGSRDYDKVHT